MDSIDLNSVLKETFQTADAFGNLATNAIPATVQQGNAILDASRKLSEDAAQAAQTKVGIEVDEIARQESTRKAIAARIGTDASNPGWVIGQAADQIKQADAGLSAESEAIRQKDSVTFLSNPLGWIANQLTINENIANYNYWARQKNRAEETARQAEQLTQQSFQTNNALSATATETYRGAMKILGAYQFNKASLDSALQGARWNMEGIIQASQASRDRLQMLYSANTAMMQEKQYQNELARLRLATGEFNMRKAAFDEKMSEDNLILKYMSDGYFNLTGKAMDKTTAGQALILYKSKHPDAIAFFESGLASAKITGDQGSKPIISLSPAKAADLVGQGKVTNLSPAMHQVGDQLVTWRRQFENQAVQTQYPFDPKDKTSKEVAFNKYVEDQKRLALANVDNSSVFAPFDINKIGAINKTVASTPLWKNVLEPASKTGVNLNDPNLVFGIVSGAMREGKLSYADALDLSLVYSAGLDMNNQTRNFIAFGLSPVKSYNVGINIPGTVGKTNVNLADGKTLATALNKAEAINAYYRMKQQPKTDLATPNTAQP